MAVDFLRSGWEVLGEVELDREIFTAHREFQGLTAFEIAVDFVADEFE